MRTSRVWRLLNERCPEDSKYMGLVGEDYWSCGYCGKVWRIHYSKAGARITNEVAPYRPVDAEVSTRRLIERICEKLGVNIEI